MASSIFNYSINPSYSKDLAKQSRERFYTKDELQAMKINNPDLTPEELKYLKLQRKYCDASKFSKHRGNREALIKSCMLMVLKVAKEFWWATGKRNVPLDDVIQAGNMGLTIAADRYLSSAVPTGTREAKFSTYAYPWIKKYVLDELNITSQELTTGTRAAYENRLAGAQFISKDDVKIGKDDEYESPINNDLKSDFKTGQEVLDAEDKQKQYTNILKKAIAGLTELERKILANSYGLGDRDPLTLMELASKYGMSASGVRATIKRAHGKIYWGISDKEREAMAHFDTVAGIDIRAMLCGENS